MVNRKIRKHSGRYTPKIPLKMKISEMIANAEEPLEVYDDWKDYRDGIRINFDKTQLRSERVNYGKEVIEIRNLNNKIKKLILLRKLKQNKLLGVL